MCLRNPWDAMKPLEYLLSTHLNLLTPPWPLNCFKVSGNRCSRIQKVPQGICWSAGVCQTVSPQKTQKKREHSCVMSLGWCHSVPKRTVEGRRLQCVCCLQAAPCGKPQPRGPRVLGVLAASLVSLLTSCPSRAEYHLLSFWGLGGGESLWGGRPVPSPFKGPVCEMRPELWFLYW